MKKILVIEDEPWQAEHTASVLSKAGYSLNLASNALEALDILDAEAVNIIILDMFLPGPNAFTLLHELKSHEDLAKIPVIIFSAQSEYSLDVLQPYGVVDLVDKTIASPAELISSVRKVIG